MDQSDDRACWHSACVEGSNHGGAHVSARGEEFTPRDDWTEIARLTWGESNLTNETGATRCAE